VRAAGASTEFAPTETSGQHRADADLRMLAAWLQGRQVLIGGLILVALSVAWRAQFLGHMYFTQDDFYNLDLAIQSPFNWHYLAFNTAGNLVLGTQVITWVLARMSLYSWGLASVVSLALVAGAGLAALRLLRTLFGDRPAILVPLAFYLLCPVTLPNFGWWSAGLESLPLQLAIFMAVDAHVRYVREGRIKQLAAAAAWLAFGLAFFEKALVLPVLLFGITSAFLVGAPSWLAGARLALRRYWRAWLAYLGVDAGYAVLLWWSLQTSTITPQAPSFGSAVSFAGGLVKDTLLPGAIGGPWRWWPVGGGSYALSAAPPGLIEFSVVLVAVVVAASVALRRTAWRAWVIFATWFVLADLVPVTIGRLITKYAGIFVLETRYVADAIPALAICLGLAFLPLAWEPQEVRDSHLRFRAYVRRPGAIQVRRRAVALLVGIFVFGSIWSAQAYESTTSGATARSYIANGTSALRLVQRGTVVLDWPVPDGIESPLFGKFSGTATVLGELEQGPLAHKIRWIAPVRGTVDGLMMFDDTGRLHFAQVYGVGSPSRAKYQGLRRCWPLRHGRIVVPFVQASSPDAWMLRIGYLWPPGAAGSVIVHFGNETRVLSVKPGVHSGYVPVSGVARNVVLDGLGTTHLCVSDAEAGWLAPALGGPVFPPNGSSQAAG
jgi:hypothetical protein